MGIKAAVPPIFFQIVRQSIGITGYDEIKDYITI